MISVEVRRGMHWSDRSAAAWWSPLVSINARGARCVAHKRPILNLADVKQLQFRRLSKAARRGFGNPQWLVELLRLLSKFFSRALMLSLRTFPSPLLCLSITSAKLTPTSFAGCKISQEESISQLQSIQCEVKGLASWLDIGLYSHLVVHFPIVVLSIFKRVESCLHTYLLNFLSSMI